jgi:predicted transcriptional regulator
MSKYVKKGYPTKLSDKDIEDIKKRIDKGETQKSIAKLYNVSQTYISMIKTGNARVDR